MRTRNRAIDILKVIGIFTIMLSHSQGMPYEVNYFRNYEVILLVMVSGMLYKDFDQESISFAYIKKRLSRIVIPTWAFLLIFFALLSIASALLHIPFPYSTRDIIESFTMTNGIGYVWIMLVYCFIAIGLPLIWIQYNKAQKTNRRVWFVVCVAAIWIVYEALRWRLDGTSANYLPAYIFKNTVMYFVAYSIIAWLGSYLGKKRAIISLWIGIALTGIHFAIIGHITTVRPQVILLSTMKYPPSLVYVLYGMGVSLIIIACVRLLCGNDATKSKILAFISKESQWVYFNHIYMVFIWNQIIGKENWVFSFFFYAIGSILLTWAQTTVIKRLFGKQTDSLSQFVLRTFC